MNLASAKAAFVASLNHIKNTVNNCNYDDTVDASSLYQGTTTKEANITSAALCGPFDGTSTWDTGTLPNKVIAATCYDSLSVLGIKNDLQEADVRFNTDRYNFTSDGTASGCSEKFDVQSIATHESGHIFGLDDIYGSSPENLTMYGESTFCTNKQRNLGVGDVLGLRSIY